MGNIKIEVLKDFRNLKKGDIYKFGEVPSTVVVGSNGCGKSSLFNALRGKINSLGEIDYTTLKSEYQELAENISIDSEYDKIFYFNAINDNAFNINTGSSALSFVESGGMEVRHLSHGQSSCTYLSMFLNKIKPQIVVGETLVILDELDNGYDLKNQIAYLKILDAISSSWGADVIAISHNAFTINDSLIVYDFEKRDYVPSKEYITNITNREITRKDEKEV